MLNFNGVSTNNLKMKSRGILTIACGNKNYIGQAISLSQSIRLRDPEMPLAIATDLPSDILRHHFDFVIDANFSDWSGFMNKLDVYDISPFDETIYLDADCLAIKPMIQVFDCFNGQQFGVFGRNDIDEPWFKSPEKIRAEFPTSTFPIFNSGLIYFTKSVLSKDVFNMAKSLTSKYDLLEIRRTRNGGMNDEPLISLAMVQLGLRATDNPILNLMQAPELPYFRISIDVIAGSCKFMRRGKLVEPVLVHFVGDRKNIYPYFRERRKLAVVNQKFSMFGYNQSIFHFQTYFHWLFTVNNFNLLFQFNKLFKGIKSIVLNK